MTCRPVVLHLVDDTTAGGVMRVLDHIRTCPEMATCAEHRVEVVKRGRISVRRYNADMVVSHLAICWRSLPALAALRVANAGRPLLHVEHSYTEAFMAHNVRSPRRFLRLLKLGFSLFDRVIAVSEGQASWIARARLCASDKLSVIRSCVDLSSFVGLRPAERKPKVLGAIGRLDNQKGFDLLIKAVRDLRRDDFELQIYGTGTELQALRALAKDDARIRFMGHALDPVQVYEAVDLVVMPSRWEAYGLVAVEALSAGRAVLCADIDGLKDHRSYGADMVSNMSAPGIATALEEVLTYGPESHAMPGQEVAARAQAAFSTGWNAVVRAHTKHEVRAIGCELKADA